MPSAVATGRFATLVVRRRIVAGNSTAGWDYARRASGYAGNISSMAMSLAVSRRITAQYLTGRSTAGAGTFIPEPVESGAAERRVLNRVCDYVTRATTGDTC